MTEQYSHQLIDVQKKKWRTTKIWPNIVCITHSNPLVVLEKADKIWFFARTANGVCFARSCHRPNRRIFLSLYTTLCPKLGETDQNLTSKSSFCPFSCVSTILSISLYILSRVLQCELKTQKFSEVHYLADRLVILQLRTRSHERVTWLIAY